MDEPAQGQPRKRAIIEIVVGEIFIFPVAGSDVERAEILDALRIYFGDQKARET